MLTTVKSGGSFPASCPPESPEGKATVMANSPTDMLVTIAALPTYLNTSRPALHELAQERGQKS